MITHVKIDTHLNLGDYGITPDHIKSLESALLNLYNLYPPALKSQKIQDSFLNVNWGFDKDHIGILQNYLSTLEYLEESKTAKYYFFRIQYLLTKLMHTGGENSLVTILKKNKVKKMPGLFWHKLQYHLACVWYRVPKKNR